MAIGERADGTILVTGGGGGLSPSSGSYSGLQAAGNITAIAGVVTGAIGAFYSAKSQQYQAKSQELAAEFRASMANLNARQAELEVEALMTRGRTQKAKLTMGYGRARGQLQASQGARGVQGGVGSAGEVGASLELAKDIDAYDIDRQIAAAMAGARRQALNYRTRAVFEGVSAANYRAAGSSISPALAAGTSLLGGASRFAYRAGRRERGDV